MARDATVNVKLTGDASGLTKATSDAETGAGKLAGFFKSHFTVTLGDVARIGGQVIDTLGGFVDAAREDEAAAAKLAKTLQNTTGATDAQVASVEKWIAKTQNATGVLDDQLRPAYENLLRATGDATKSQDLMALAMDISAGTGKDLESVTLALGKAANGNVGALGKLGIATKDASGATLTFDQLTQNLASTFGGQMATAAGTAEGQQARLKARFEDIKETIGGALIPALAMLTTVFLSLAETGAKVVTWITSNWSTVGPILIGAAIGITAALVPAFIAWATTAGAAAVATLTAAAPVIAIGVAVAALAAGIIYLYNHCETFRNIVQAVGAGVVAFAGILRDGFLVAVNFVLALWSRFGDDLLRIAQGIWTAISALISGALTAIQGIIGTVLAAIAAIWSATWDAISAAASAIWSAITTVITTAINGVSSVISSVLSAISSIWSATWNAISGVASF